MSLAIVPEEKLCPDQVVLEAREIKQSNGFMRPLRRGRVERRFVRSAIAQDSRKSAGAG